MLLPFNVLKKVSLSPSLPPLLSSFSISLPFSWGLTVLLRLVLNLACPCLCLLTAGLVGMHGPIKCPFLLSLRVSNYNMELRDMLQKVGVLQKSLMLWKPGRLNSQYKVSMLHLLLPSSPFLYPPYSSISHFFPLIFPLLSLSFSFVAFTEYLRGASKNWNHMGRAEYVQRLS